jgi:nitrogen fixation protein NifU and related proteins
MYSETVMEHFTSPQNVGHMPDADGMGTIGEPGCGDNCVIFIKVREETIHDIRFLIFGCGAAIACGSMTTVLAKGKTIQAALKITEQNIIDALDGLPEAKQHCSNLGVAALRAAIHNYWVTQKQTLKEQI